MGVGDWDAKPADVEAELAKEQYPDCLPCRAVGSIALVGLGGYTGWHGFRDLRTREAEILRSGSKYKMGSRKLGVVSLSAMFIGMGIYRAIA